VTFGRKIDLFRGCLLCDAGHWLRTRFYHFLKFRPLAHLLNDVAQRLQSGASDAAARRRLDFCLARAVELGLPGVSALAMRPLVAGGLFLGLLLAALGLSFYVLSCRPGCVRASAVLGFLRVGEAPLKLLLPLRNLLVQSLLSLRSAFVCGQPRPAGWSFLPTRLRATALAIDAILRGRCRSGRARPYGC